MYIKDPLAGLKLRLGTHSTGNLKKILYQPSQPIQSTLHKGGSPDNVFKVKFLFTTAVSPLTQHSLQTTVMPRRQTFHCQCCLHAYILCCLTAGGLMVFSAVSRVSSFEADNDTDNSVDPGWENTDIIYASLHHVNAEQEKSYSKADLSKQN